MKWKHLFKKLFPVLKMALNNQVKWELLKYEIRKFAIKFSRKPAQNFRKTQATWKLKLKI